MCVGFSLSSECSCKIYQFQPLHNTLPVMGAGSHRDRRHVPRRQAVQVRRKGLEGPSATPGINISKHFCLNFCCRQLRFG